MLYMHVACWHIVSACWCSVPACWHIVYACWYIVHACWYSVSACWHTVYACWHIVPACWHGLSKECYRHFGNVVHVKFDTVHPPYICYAWCNLNQHCSQFNSSMKHVHNSRKIQPNTRLTKHSFAILYTLLRKNQLYSYLTCENRLSQFFFIYVL